jgi:N-succinyldiaminopimelate aminotransferase
MSQPKRARISPLVKAEMGGGGSKLWSEITELARLPTIVSDLGQGYPDFNGDLVARETTAKVLVDNARLNQYSLVNGSVDLRKELANFYAKRHPKAEKLNFNTEVLVTSSGTESLYAGILATVSEGDEVIVFEPSFPWYAPDIRLAGGIVKTVTLKYPHFTVDEKELRAAFSSKTRLVIFNSPHNPTGHVARKSEVELIANLCVEHDAMCISDEVYDQFIFNRAKTGDHLRMCDQPGMKDRTLTVGSASKMFSLTGWRVGWLYGPEDHRSKPIYPQFCFLLCANASPRRSTCCIG